MIGSVARVPLSVASGRLTQDTVETIVAVARQEVPSWL